MDESTLNLEYTAIQQQVALSLGWDFETVGNWTTEQTAQFAKILQAGLNRFYYAGGTDTEPHYEWSFLRITADISAVASTTAYSLPADFSGILLGDSITYAAGASEPSLSRIDEQQWRNLVAQENKTDPPRYYAIRPTAFTAATGLRYEILLYPTPDASYTLTYAYRTLPNVPTLAGEYIRAPATHAQTIIEAILAAAEELIDDDPEGVHEMRYRMALQASIRHDRAIKEAEGAGRFSFPIDNLEDDSLRVTYFTLLRRVGEHIGYGYNPSTWTHAKLKEVDQIIESGYRKFLYPEPIDQQMIGHEWSFLRPVGEMTVVSGQHTYSLPQDFDSLHGNMTFGGTNNSYPPIQETSANRIRELRNGSDYTSIPQWCATAPVQSNGTSDQVQQMLFYPTPGSTYILEYQYHAVQRKLSETNKYPVGGVVFGELLLSSCLAEAELQKSGKRGAFFRDYQGRLATAISSDYRRLPRVLGYNGHRFIGRASARRAGMIDSNLVTYG